MDIGFLNTYGSSNRNVYGTPKDTGGVDGFRIGQALGGANPSKTTPTKSSATQSMDTLSLSSATIQQSAVKVATSETDKTDTVSTDQKLAEILAGTIEENAEGAKQKTEQTAGGARSDGDMTTH